MSNHESTNLARRGADGSTCRAGGGTLVTIALNTLTQTQRKHKTQDRTGQDRTGQDRTGQDRTGQDRTGQDRTGQDRTGQDRSEQDRLGQDRSGYIRTGQDRTGQGRVKDRTGQDRTGQSKGQDWLVILRQWAPAAAAAVIHQKSRASNQHGEGEDATSMPFIVRGKYRLLRYTSTCVHQQHQTGCNFATT